MKITLKRKPRLKEESSGYDIAGRALEALTELHFAMRSGEIEETDSSLPDVLDMCSQVLEMADYGSSEQDEDLYHKAF
ncbi:MAG: hypothetical protein WC364_12110 [Eubacteriales bacterium]